MTSRTVHVPLHLAALFVAGAFLVGATAPGKTPKAHVVAVTARDFAFTMPASIPAGLTTFRLYNRGKQVHHFTVVRLDEGKTAADAMKALMDTTQPRPAWMHQAGGPQGTMPGRSGNATLVLEPGNYVAFCEVPGPTAMPHFMRGMMKAFTVTGASHPAALPASDDTLSLTDYDFTFSHPLTKGRHTIAVTNNAAQPHMVVMTSFDKDATFKEWLGWAMDPKGKMPPGKVGGGVTEISPGQTVVFTGDFAPGHYGMICFSPDPHDGKPHFMHGMQKEFDIH